MLGGKSQEPIKASKAGAAPAPFAGPTAKDSRCKRPSEPETNMKIPVVSGEPVAAC